MLTCRRRQAEGQLAEQESPVWGRKKKEDKEQVGTIVQRKRVRIRVGPD